ncbi:MAG: tetratricopeptide repeat protein [Planctomycetota bacterium]
MPETRSKLTLATALRQTADDLTSTVAVEVVCDGIKKCLESPSLSWPAAVAGTAAAAGVFNPVTVAGLVGLGVAFGINRFRHKQKEAHQLEAELRKQAAEHESMHDILLSLQDGSLTVGLDELALTDLREIVSDVFDKKVDRLSDQLEGLFDESLDDLPPGPLRDELDNLRILAQDTNLTVHKNAAALAKQDEKIDALMKKFEALSPANQDAIDPENNVLESALTRIAQDAERGVEAARRAIEDKSPQEAGDYFTDKLAALDEAKQAVAKRIAEEEVQLSREAAEVLYRTGRIAEAEQALQRILAHDPDDLDATNRLGHIDHLRGDLKSAIARYRQILELSDNNSSSQAAALGNLGLIAKTRGDLKDAEKLLSESLDINRKLGRLEHQATQLGNLGVITKLRGHLEDAEKFHREALTINRELGILEGQAVQLANLGLIAKTRGNLEDAERLINESLDINRDLERLEMQAADLGYLGCIALDRGNLEDAGTLLNESLDINRKLENLQGQAADLGNLGLVVRTQGDLGEAEKLHRESLDINRKLGRLEGQANQLANLGTIAILHDNLKDAEKLLNESLDINRKLGRLEGQANQLANLGLIAEARSHREEALQRWTESRDLYRYVGVPHMVEQLQSWLDRLDTKS